MDSIRNIFLKNGIQYNNKSKLHLRVKFIDFTTDIYALFISNWKRNEEDLRWFTQKFDYRFKDEPWKNSKDALPRVVGKIVGFSK